MAPSRLKLEDATAYPSTRYAANPEFGYRNGDCHKLDSLRREMAFRNYPPEQRRPDVVSRNRLLPGPPVPTRGLAGIAMATQRLMKGSARNRIILVRRSIFGGGLSQGLAEHGSAIPLRTRFMSATSSGPSLLGVLGLMWASKGPCRAMPLVGQYAFRRLGRVFLPLGMIHRNGRGEALAQA